MGREEARLYHCGSTNGVVCGSFPFSETSPTPWVFAVDHGVNRESLVIDRLAPCVSAWVGPGGLADVETVKCA